MYALANLYIMLLCEFFQTDSALCKILHCIPLPCSLPFRITLSALNIGRGKRTKC